MCVWTILVSSSPPSYYLSLSLSLSCINSLSILFNQPPDFLQIEASATTGKPEGVRTSTGGHGGEGEEGEREKGEGGEVRGNGKVEGQGEVFERGGDGEGERGVRTNHERTRSCIHGYSTTARLSE